MTYTEEKFGIDLTKEESWTPLLIYINRSRLITGFILGFIAGLLLMLK